MLGKSLGKMNEAQYMLFRIPTYAKILGRVRDHVWQFYGNCRTLYR